LQEAAVKTTTLAVSAAQLAGRVQPKGEAAEGRREFQQSNDVATARNYDNFRPFDSRQVLLHYYRPEDRTLRYAPRTNRRNWSSGCPATLDILFAPKMSRLVEAFLNVDCEEVEAAIRVGGLVVGLRMNKPPEGKERGRLNELREKGS
jgi:hypothetical protein